MTFCESLRDLCNNFGVSAFDGTKSLHMLMDYNAFASCKALQTIYGDFLKMNGNDILIAAIEHNLSSKNLSCHQKKFMHMYRHRSDMVNYLYSSIEVLISTHSYASEPIFEYPYDVNYKPLSKTPFRFPRTIATKPLTLLSIVFIVHIVFIGYYSHTSTSRTSTPIGAMHNGKCPIEREDKYKMYASVNGHEDGFNNHEYCGDNPKGVTRINEASNAVVNNDENAMLYALQEKPDLTKNVPSAVTNQENIESPNEYLALAEKYLGNSNTHHLAEKYAKLALANGITDGKRVLNQLKILGYYD